MHIYKNSPRRRDEWLAFTSATTDWHIYYNGEWVSKSDIFDAFYKEPSPGESFPNTKLEMIKGLCHPDFAFRPRPTEWTDKKGVKYPISSTHSGADEEAESTKELVRNKCMAELRSHGIMSNDKNEITMQYDTLLEMMHNVSYKLVTNAFKVWEGV